MDKHRVWPIEFDEVNPSSHLLRAVVLVVGLLFFTFLSKCKFLIVFCVVLLFYELRPNRGLRGLLSQLAPLPGAKINNKQITKNKNNCDVYFQWLLEVVQLKCHQQPFIILKSKIYTEPETLQIRY